MSGPEHYREAERLLSIPGLGSTDDPRDPIIVAEAQVHATLALVAAQAEDFAFEVSDRTGNYINTDWVEAIA